MNSPTIVSWIHERDFCRAVEWILTHPSLAGPVNVAAPCPVPNREMMQCLRTGMGIRWGLPAARWMLCAGAWLLRTEVELVVKSRRVVPGRLRSSGFQFEFERMEPALRDLLCARTHTRAPGKGGV